MRISAVPASLAALLAASLGQAQYLINELSFGYSGRLSPPESPGYIPNFVISGQPGMPELLSNKIILTPVSPGNYRGAIWSEKPLQHTSFIADVDFRANGPERAGGNLNIWLVRNGNQEIGASSVYKVGKFEGLVLVVDPHGGSGGMLRGFLNDGTVDYSQHYNVDKLAFGHCQYSYRNLGRPSQIKMRQTPDMFRVEIDSQLCFETNKVNLPAGYNFGVTAATPDNPDSFEVFRMVVMSEKSNDEAANNNKIDYTSRSQQVPGDNNNDNNNNNQASSDDAFDNIADENADVFQTSKAQFEDLHNRLQVTNHQISVVYREVSKHHRMDEQRHNEIKELLTSIQDKLNQLEQIDVLMRRVSTLDQNVRGLPNDIHRKMAANEKVLKGVLSNHHDSLMEQFMDGVPGHGKLIAVIVGTQVVLVVAYVVYKRRRANSPKKYL